ncbi:MAG: hypothetical protein HY042_05295 [Spirochaetia bacterium]|nr:hypothetical protein [Spirochaetia bacterium]
MKNNQAAILGGAVLAAVSLAFAGGLFAQPQGKGAACANDRTTFCKDVKPGQGRIWMCLKSHEDKLSAGCTDHMAKVKEQHKEFSKACKKDYKQFCKDVKPGDGKIVQCLKENKAKLSADCKAKFDQHPADHD